MKALPLLFALLDAGHKLKTSTLHTEVVQTSTQHKDKYKQKTYSQVLNSIPFPKTHRHSILTLPLHQKKMTLMNDQFSH